MKGGHELITDAFDHFKTVRSIEMMCGRWIMLSGEFQEYREKYRFSNAFPLLPRTGGVSRGLHGGVHAVRQYSRSFGLRT